MNDLERHEYRKTLKLVVEATKRKDIPPSTIRYLNSQASKLLQRFKNG